MKVSPERSATPATPLPTFSIATGQLWYYIWTMVRSFPAGLSVMLWVALIWSVDLSLKPYLLKIILNKLTTGSALMVYVDLWLPIALYLGVHLMLSISFRLYGYFVEIKMIPNLRRKIANDALGRLMDQSHGFYQNNFSGSLANKINDLTASVPDLVQILSDRFVSHSIALVLAIVTLWTVSPWFGIFMLTWTSTFIILALLFSKKITILVERWSEYGSLITGKSVDVLSNMLSVRLFSGKENEKQSLSKTFDEAVKAEQKVQWSYFWMWMIYGFSAITLHGLNFYVLCKGRYEGWITVGDFALVMVLNHSIMDFLWQIAREFTQFSKLYGRISQALRVVLHQPELTDPPLTPDLHVTKGDIVFSKVKFRYEGAEPLFEDKSVIIPGGQKVGLVGYSGGGKSTFVNLILRLYNVTKGEILIDGQNIAKVTQKSLRNNIAMIPQDPSLFHRTLKENIQYGRMTSSSEEVIEAARKAHAHDFIMNLPEGYDSLVGERGVKLSGGQRQRIAIARAILKNAPILILDEATSQLDSLTESDIQDSLWQLMQGKTTIIIAHRLSTLLRMDRILVFDQGRIIEDGSHEDLLARGGLYKTLWEAQVGGYLPDRKEEE